MFYKKVHPKQLPRESPTWRREGVLKELKRQHALDDGEKALHREGGRRDHQRYEREKAAAKAMEAGAEKAMQEVRPVQAQFYGLRRKDSPCATPATHLRVLNLTTRCLFRLLPHVEELR